MIHSFIFRQLDQYVHFNPYNGSISRDFNKNSYITILGIIAQGRIKKIEFFQRKKMYDTKDFNYSIKVLDMISMFTLSDNYLNIVKKET